MNTSEIFAEIMKGIAGIYGKSMSSSETKLYWNCVKDYDGTQLAGAFEIHLKNPDGGKFFPRPADIIRIIDGGGDGNALIAWTKFAKALGRVGTYQSVCFDDKKIHAVVEDMGGWVKFGKVLEREMPFLQKEFIDRYKSMPKNRQCSERLCGLVEKDTSHQGLPPPEVVHINERITHIQCIPGDRRQEDLRQMRSQQGRARQIV